MFSYDYTPRVGRMTEKYVLVFQFERICLPLERSSCLQRFLNKAVTVWSS